MDLGNLDWRVRFERKTVSRDAAFGSENITWTEVGTFWCNVEDINPWRSKTTSNDLTQGSTQTRVRLRYRSDLDMSMRMVIMRPDPIVYQIVGGPTELGWHEGIEFLVERFTS